jgi:methyltransferase (TIGR00027 family)
MSAKPPSRTAFAAAAHRAAHQVLEGGRIFRDPLSVRILGMTDKEVGEDAKADPSRAGMRFFIACRTAIAETAIGEAVETRGVEQLVVLGAGLDTFAYRNPFADRLKVFEVDHPGTQTWKKERLAHAGIAIPDDLVYAAVDFEHDNLMDRLAEAGLNLSKRTFFLWLGVVPYLTREAIIATLGAVGRLPGGAEIAFDYGNPPDDLPPDMRAAFDQRAARVAALGEPFLSFFKTPVMHALLKDAGFSTIEDNGPSQTIERFLEPEVLAAVRARGAAQPRWGSHVLVAMTPGAPARQSAEQNP